MAFLSVSVIGNWFDSKYFFLNQEVISNLLFLIILILLPFSSFSEEISKSSISLSSFDHCRLDHPQILFVHFWDQRLNCDDAKEFTRVVNDVNDLVSSSSLFGLYISHLNFNNSYDESGFISISNRLINKRYIYSLDKTKTVWAHEYGHLIFQEIIANKFMPISEQKLAYEKAFNIALEIPILEDKIKFSKDENEVLKLQQEIKKISDESEKLYRKIEENESFKKLDLLFHPYAELYADLIAVLYKENPRAEYEVSIYPGSSEEEIEIASVRNFTVEHQLAGWKFSEKHGLLAPTKSFLYLKLWPLKYEISEKRNLLQIVFHSILSELENRWGTALEFLTPEEINFRLITKIKHLIK